MESGRVGQREYQAQVGAGENRFGRREFIGEVSHGRTTITVRGTDAAGAMYGGLDIAEAIRTGTLESLQNSDHAPHGLKFNVPLDLRTPSYTDPSDAAQANIPEVWSMDFWREFLDDMARHRYNVLTLWSLHPFPSIVKVPEFPNVALDDVWRTTAKLDDKFDHNGNNFVRSEMLAHHEVVKRITIAKKIPFWRDVMQLAKDRGVDVYWFTWNVFLHGAEGKDGITSDKGAPRTIEYFRASVRETIKTYPLLAGNAAADVQLARDWKPGTIAEAAIKRSGSRGGLQKVTPGSHRSRIGGFITVRRPRTRRCFFLPRWQMRAAPNPPGGLTNAKPQRITHLSMSFTSIFYTLCGVWLL